MIKTDFLQEIKRFDLKANRGADWTENVPRPATGYLLPGKPGGEFLTSKLYRIVRNRHFCSSFDEW